MAAEAADRPRSDMAVEFVLQWHITHRCNLRCSHCYQDDYFAFADRAAFENVLSQYERLLNAYGFRGHINITGGEPLLHPDFYWLLNEIKQRNMTFAVLTNGTTLTLRDARRLKRLGALYVQVSLDGSQSAHDAIRGDGSFERALNGIRALKTAGIYTDVSFTVGCGNRGELKDLARLCKRLGVDKLWFDRVIIPKERDIHNQSLSADEYAELCKTAASLNRRGMVSCARALQFLPCREKRIYRCSAGKTLLAITADGSVMPCRRLSLTAGNVNDSELLTIYRDSPLLNEIRNAPVPEGCKGCAYESECAGGAKCASFAKCGSYLIRDPDCMVKIP